MWLSVAGLNQSGSRRRESALISSLRHREPTHVGGFDTLDQNPALRALSPRNAQRVFTIG